MLKKRQKSDALWGVPFLFLKVYKNSTPVSNRNYFMFSKGELSKILQSTQELYLETDSHGDWREDIFYNGRNGNYRKINGKGYVFRIK